MKLIEVVAVEDRSRADGGHAVILLRGMKEAPSGVAFDLKPMAAGGDDDTEAPLVGLTDLRALGVTMTADGTALSIGPEIAESPLFVPGAGVEITLPELAVRGEFLWPAITPHARPKRRNIMIRRNLADPLQRPVAASGSPLPAGREASAVESAAAVAPFATAREAELARAPETLPETSPEPRTAARRPIVLSSAQPRRALAEPVSPVSPVSTPVVEAATADPVPHPGKMDLAREMSAPRDSAVNKAHGLPLVSQFRSAPDASSLPSLTGARVGRSISAGSAVALAAAILVAGQMLAFRALDLSVVARPGAAPAVASTSPATSAALKAEPAPALSPAPEPGIPGQRSVYDVISAGPHSPRGVAAADVSPAAALQRAHALLHGSEAERDPEEAAYWLKRYLSEASGGDPVRIALTQLGSALAHPVRGERDFASARIVWELSSALGDPVAMCFIGAMHEHGLGGIQSSRIASAWYERAAVSGRTCVTGLQDAGGVAR